MITGDSLFVGDAARPDLAVEATRGRGRPLPQPAPAARAARRRRGVSRPCRRLSVRRRHELEGLVDDRRRAALQPRARARRRGGVRRRTRARLARRGRRTWTASSSSTAARSSRAQPPLEPVDPATAHRPRRADRRRVRRRPPPRRLQRPRLGLVVRDEGRPSSSPATSRSSLHARRRRRLSEPRAGLRAVGLFELARLPRRRPTRARSSSRSRSRSSTGCSAGTVEVLDVRETAERDEGYIAGTPHLPYRLRRAPASTTCEASRPVVTICSSGSRAGDRGERARSERRRRAPGRRRRHRGLGRARRQDGRSSAAAAASPGLPQPVDYVAATRIASRIAAQCSSSRVRSVASTSVSATGMSIPSR